MPDLNDLNRPVTTDTEPNVLDTLRAHIARAATWAGWSSTANKVAGLMSGVFSSVSGGVSMRLYRRNNANTADEEVVSLPNVSVGGSAGSVPWTGVSGRPTAVSAFANDSGYVTPDSPTFTGTPQAPTATPGTNTAQLATTAHVFAERSNAATLINKTLTSPALTTPVTTGGREVRVAMPAGNIDLSTGNYFTRTITGSTALTVSNVPSAGTAVSFVLDLTQAGSATVTWWTGVRWAGGVAPILSAAGRDVLGFFTHDGGSNWTGLLLGRDVK